MQLSFDQKMMRHALVLARRGLGQVAPNPAVGCVIVKNSIVIAEGWTQPGGRPHAEAMALAAAEDGAKGATTYVTLEPCSHHGQTGPCVLALVEAGIKKVVYAVQDPDPRVKGRGHNVLEAAGVEVISSVEADAAEELNAGFFLNQQEKRPLFTLKIAQSEDGHITVPEGTDKWITGPEARAKGHMMRAQHDAIMVGIGTVLADDPSLTCRIDGLEDRSPIRIVLDSHLRMPTNSKLVQTAMQVPLWVITSDSYDKNQAKTLEAAGAKIFTCETPRDVGKVANILATEGLTRVLVEGGSQTHASFLEADLADRLAVFTAPFAFGDKMGVPNETFNAKKLEHSARFRHTHSQRCGVDQLNCYERIK